MREMLRVAGRLFSWCVGLLLAMTLLISIPSSTAWAESLPRWIVWTYATSVFLIGVTFMVSDLYRFVREDQTVWEWLRGLPIIFSVVRDMALRKAQLIRLLVRTLRIATGAAIGLVSATIIGWAVDMLSKPFATLSPLQLIGGLGGMVFGLGCVYWAFVAAFGEGDRREVDRLKAEQSRVKAEQSRVSRKSLGYDD